MLNHTQFGENPKGVVFVKTTEMLKKNYEFKYVLNNGKYYSGEQIIAFIIKNNRNINFLGLAISTKVRKGIYKK